MHVKMCFHGKKEEVQAGAEKEGGVSVTVDLPTLLLIRRLHNPHRERSPHRKL